MKKLTTFVVAGLTAMALTAPAVSGDVTKHAIFVIDLNDTNPARNARYAEGAIETLIEDFNDLGLGFGDKISRRSAGNPSPMEHLDWVVDDKFVHGRVEPNDVGPFLRETFTALADEPPHAGSDIIGALSRLAGTVNCSAGSIFVVSNIVDAGRVEGNSFIYPGLPGTPFQGCEITIMGFGMNSSYDVYTLDAAKEVVTSILTSAGFTRVSIK